MVIASEKSTGKLKKRGADATTITLSISMEDKELAKKLAADCNASVSDMLHKWIRQECRNRKRKTDDI
ncbi:MAG: hypothetical protein IIZ41_03740 [Lachnospiraceae bacterium]|nr:hypothetical protein [Lachnospiraceae bacterium]